MFDFLKHKKEDSWADKILVIVIRLTITGLIVMLGFSWPLLPRWGHLLRRIFGMVIWMAVLE